VVVVGKSSLNAISNGSVIGIDFIVGPGARPHRSAFTINCT